MGRAYLTIANSGFRTELSAIRKIEDREGNVLYERPIVDPKTRKRILKRRSYGLIAEGLKSVVRYGTGYKVRHLSGKVAGKTGTSNKSKDNWFCGFTKDIVVIAWMGNDDQNSFRGNISASNTAAPLWARFVKKSLKELKSGWLGQASGITSAKVHPKFGHRDPSGIRMYFLPGQTPREDESDLLLLEQGKQLRVGMNDF
jgi:penicillin-binding protein 1A